MTVAILFFVAHGTLFSAGSSELKTEYDRWVRRSWTTRDGLPQNTVYALAQGADGCMWIGSEGGAARFDGAAFTIYRKGTTPGLASDSVTSLALGPDGSLWAGTFGGGVTIGRDGRFARVTGLSGERIWSLHREESGCLWAVLDDGRVFCLEQGKKPALAVIDGLPGGRATAISGGENKILWVGTRDGLVTIRDGRQAIIRSRDGLAGDDVYCLFVDRRGRLWVGTTSGLSCIDGSGIRSFSTRDGLADDFVRAIGEDGLGRLWIGTDKGVTVLEDGDRVRCASPEGLAGDAVMAILRDREDGMWLGWAGNGLSLLRRNEVRVYGPKDGLSGRQLRSVCEDEAGRIWTGTRDQGLNVLVGGQWRSVSKIDGLASNAVTALFPARDERLWIGTLDAGLQVMADGMRLTPPPPESPAKDAILSLHSQNGRDLWVGCNGSGLYELSDGAWRHHGAANGLRATVITALGHDGHMTLWAGSLGEGLFSYSRHSRSWRKAPVDGLDGESIFTIFCAGGKGLWLGTSAGLALLRGDELQRFDRGPEPLRRTILQIIEDDHGWLWMSTPSGIIRAEKAALEAAAPLGGLGVHCRQFGEMSGMLSTSCSGGIQPAGWLGKAARLWFPTQNGLVMIDPHLLKSCPPPVPRLMSVQADGITMQNGQTLSAGSRRIAFAFAAASFADPPEQIEFSSRLEGLEKDWSNPGTERGRQFTGLGSGSYAFRVRARGQGGEWSDDARIRFSIAPRFFQTGWFYLLTLGGAGLLGMGLWTWRRRRVHSRQEDKYRSSPLDRAKAGEYAARLEELMERDKPYLDPDLTLAKLAEAAAIPAKHLSQVINEYYRLNFNDFVNRRRVEEAKRLLLDPAAREFKLLRIAFESGFNSKSVFNAAFRKHAGASPSEFRRLLGDG